MRGTKRAAVAMAAVMITAVGCSSADNGAGDPKPPTSPRPQGTGPLTESVVRADLDTSVADAGVPANAPEYGEHRGSADSPLSCGVYFKGFGTDTASVDLARFEQLVGELRERAWQQPEQRTERKDLDGAIGVAEVWLSQRGWRMSVEYRSPPDEGVITVKAYDTACLRKHDVGLEPGG
ncbi:hypothetical protein ACFV14_26065 [Streptomyces zaomyceticus]|uniref:hypothetical protein n=1 Tax=Streptomyces zaomyceticus TaxID=68286 RepID=UPI0036C7376D